MDAFVKFLLDYYIWILAVIGISIVTVIGFLVDSKQKRKKKEEAVLKNSTEVKTTEDLVNTQDNLSLNTPVNVQDTTSVNNVLGGDGNYITEPTTKEQVPVSNTVVSDGLSLSAQTPQFAPREVNVPVNQPQNEVVSSNVGQVIPPKPVNAVPINQLVQPTPVNVTSVNQGVQPAPVNVAPVSQSVNMFQQPLNNQIQQNVASSPVVEQPAVMSQANVYPSMAQNTVVSNVQQSSLNNQGVATSVVQPTMPLNTSVPQTSVQAQQVNQVPNVGISFVTGEDNTNNDTWKL